MTREINMKSVLLTTAAAVVVAVAIAASAISAPPPATGRAPERAATSSSPTRTRLAHELHYFKDASAIVLMSQVNGGKTSREGAARARQAANRLQGPGRPLLHAINSKDTRDAAAAEARVQKFAFPVLMDELQLVGEQLGIQREGEIFVVTPKTGFKIAYHGTAAEASKSIDAILAGKPVANPRVEVKAGAAIAFPGTREQGRARKNLLLRRSRPDHPGQVRRLPPGRRHRPLRNG
jgi:hypothetical protein